MALRMLHCRASDSVLMCHPSQENISQLVEGSSSRRGRDWGGKLRIFSIKSHKKKRPILAAQLLLLACGAAAAGGGAAAACQRRRRCRCWLRRRCGCGRGAPRPGKAAAAGRGSLVSRPRLR